MNLSDFDYILPKDLIAQYPQKKRDEARLMVLNRRTRAIEHTVFSALGANLAANDLLVLNDTRVLSCRLIGSRASGGKAEALLLGVKNGVTFNALLKPARLKLNERISFDSGAIFGVISGRNEITFEAADLGEVYRHGCMPLPPYIKRQAEELDRDYYQTVYAAVDGAVAAPTAGLHFTPELIERLKSSGINFAYLTLHVGAGTFKPVKAMDVTTHKMDPEYFRVPETCVTSQLQARKAGGRVIAVGTTSLRALEARAAGRTTDHTDLFIYPGYEFKAADCLLTNFHLPKTTLFMLACAFGGQDLIKIAYRQAIEQKYRFYSYGDAMLII
ncbi:MAG: tRNA preQ1(34) S-adenosylmethionine ribosyltransferase-isomerase QueA [Candidatus Omnitrophota bacterium]|nr:tRNA preQ1(34) S-adenosylmethionine ribosyltransferase-isomerase QueA [Candidatus Omnitrophota bacterium]